MTNVIDEDRDLQRAGGPGATESADNDGTKGLLGLSVPQLLGGAGAAVSSAVVASYLGVAGTLVGAALGSIVSTVSAALYTDWAKSAHDRLPTPKRVAVVDGSRPGGTRASALEDGPVVITAGRARRKRRLRRLIVGAALMFVLAIAAVTAIELRLGHPFSNQEERGGTSIGSVVTTSDVAPTPEPSTPATQPTQTPADGTTSPPSDTSPSNDGGATSTSTPSDSATATSTEAPTTGGGQAGTPQPQDSTPAN